MSPVKRLQPTTVQQRFSGKISRIARKYEDKQIGKELKHLGCSEPIPSRLHVLPKDHKQGCLRGRPIVAAVDAPATGLSMYLAHC